MRKFLQPKVIHIVALAHALQSTFAFVSADEKTGLPFAGMDVIRIVEGERHEKRMSGFIEDIKGQTLTFRRGDAGQVQFLRISDVLELQFGRSEQWNDGLTAREEGDDRRALILFDRALDVETRSWAWVELQAIAVKTLIRLGNRRQALDRLLEIEKRDNRSRHFSLIPLVWDERLPESERLMMNSAGLRAESPVTQLAAASSLLHERLYHADAKATLERLRRSGNSTIVELAETQLWRLPLLKVSQKARPLAVWQDRVRMLPAESRHGPSYVLGRCLQHRNDHDAAVVPLLWCAFMAPTDNALGAIALAEAIRSHRQSGRTKQAELLTAELKSKYGEEHFATNLLQTDE